MKDSCRQYKSLGQPVGFVEVHRRNGQLFLDYMKLMEFQPGLFFTGHGEALDLRGSVPRWKTFGWKRSRGRRGESLRFDSKAKLSK